MFGSWTESLTSFADQATQAIEKAGEAAQSATTSLVENAKVAQAVVIKKLEDTQADFAKEEAKNEEKKRRLAEAEASEATPLWTIVREDQTVLAGELKQQILKIPTDEKLFLECPLQDDHDPTFPFSLDATEKWALKAIDCDPLLGKIRFRIVRPKSLDDFHFWRAYFFKVFQLRENMGVGQLFDASKGALAEQARRAEDRERAAAAEAGATEMTPMTEEEGAMFSDELHKFIEEDDGFVDLGDEVVGDAEGDDEEEEGVVEDEEVDLENLEEMLADVEVDEGDEGMEADMEAELDTAIEADVLP